MGLLSAVLITYAVGYFQGVMSNYQADMSKYDDFSVDILMPSNHEEEPRAQIRITHETGKQETYVIVEKPSATPEGADHIFIDASYGVPFVKDIDIAISGKDNPSYHSDHVKWTVVYPLYNGEFTHEATGSKEHLNNEVTLNIPRQNINWTAEVNTDLEQDGLREDGIIQIGNQTIQHEGKFYPQGESSQGQLTYEANVTWSILKANQIENEGTPASIKVATFSILTLALVMFGALKLTQRIRMSDKNDLIEPLV
jgi:hypothetical protein